MSGSQPHARQDCKRSWADRSVRPLEKHRISLAGRQQLQTHAKGLTFTGHAGTRLNGAEIASCVRNMCTHNRASSYCSGWQCHNIRTYLGRLMSCTAYQHLWNVLLRHCSRAAARGRREGSPRSANYMAVIDDLLEQLLKGHMPAQPHRSIREGSLAGAGVRVP